MTVPVSGPARVLAGPVRVRVATGRTSGKTASLTQTAPRVRVLPRQKHALRALPGRRRAGCQWGGPGATLAGGGADRQVRASEGGSLERLARGPGGAGLARRHGGPPRARPGGPRGGGSESARARPPGPPAVTVSHGKAAAAAGGPTQDIKPFKLLVRRDGQ